MWGHPGTYLHEDSPALLGYNLEKASGVTGGPWQARLETETTAVGDAPRKKRCVVPGPGPGDAGGGRELGQLVWY